MKVQHISTAHALEQRREDWDALTKGSNHCHPFLEIDWFLLWLRHFGRKAQPYVLSADNGVGVLGIWPLVASRSSLLLNARVLTFPGQGLADYQGLALREDAPEVIGALASYLSGRNDWDLLWMSDVRGDLAQSQVLPQALQGRGLKVISVPSLACPYLAISGSWPEYYEGVRSNSARKNIRRSLRKLEECGTVAFRHYTHAKEVEKTLGDTFRLHDARWFDRFTTTPYSRSVGRAFFREIAEAYANRGLLDLATLELDDRAIAFSFSFRYPGRYYYYIPAFDPQFASYSPGTLLMIHLMEMAFDKGLNYFDFMKGDEGYKWQWTTTYNTNVGLMAANNTARGHAALRLLRTYHRVRWHLRSSEDLRRMRREGFGRVKGWARRMRI